MSTRSEQQRKPAAGYHPEDRYMETTAFAKRVSKRRKRNKLAASSRKKNR